jgi:transcriptional regulator with XRE-family HTH domain
MTNFIERLNMALQTRNISPAELARKIGVHEGTISNYRKGRYEPKQKRLEEIAAALNVDIAWLMGADVPMTKKTTPSVDDEIVSAFTALPEEKRQQVLDFIKFLGEKE